ncbi:MAG TPA: 30S ribosomal protein S8 [candidate division Zixibacteria bacterium]|nr:30S ribosomal protein S8 [candidate division Zixibacteria bacterium]
MSMTDTIADLLTRIRNAAKAKQRRVDIPSSTTKIRIAEVLKRMNYLRTVEFVEDGKQGILVVRLRYTPDSKSVITGLERISRPGLRIYYDKDKLAAGSRRMGTVILSTSRGILTDKEALEAGVGGEALFRVW